MKIITFTLTISLLSASADEPLKPQQGAPTKQMSQIAHRAKLSAVTADFKALRSGLDMYKINAKHYPTQDQGFSALITKPTTDPIPERWVAIMASPPKDPWKSPYLYRFPGKKDPNTPEFISLGPDKKLGTKDDISSQITPDPADVSGHAKRAKITATKSDFVALQSCLDIYKTHAKRYPTEKQGLAALVRKPATTPLPKRWMQLLKKVPTDVWSTPYQYKYPGTIDPSNPEIISAGPDKKFGSKDDLSSQK